MDIKEPAPITEADKPTNSVTAELDGIFRQFRSDWDRLAIALSGWLADNLDADPEDRKRAQRNVVWLSRPDRPDVHDPDRDIFDLTSSEARFRAKTRGRYEERQREERSAAAKSFWGGR